MSQTTYGMTSAISLAGPTPLDIRLSKTLEDTLRSFDMFETDEQMALRLGSALSSSVVLCESYLFFIYFCLCDHNLVYCPRNRHFRY